MTAPALTRDDVEAGLRHVGLRTGDIVLLHSSLSSLGVVEGGADALVDAFLGVLGADGTLLVPIFGALGVVTEVVRNRQDAVRSIHPRSAVAAIGRDAEALCKDHWKAEMAHGPDTPYTRIAARGGYVCLLGVDQDRNTTLHTAEELLRLPYLRRTGEFTFDTPEGEVTKSWPYFPGPHRDFIGLDRALRERGVVRVGRIGGCVVRLMRASDLIDSARELGARNPAFALCDNPNCADCVRQRAALRRARFGSEPFTIAVSSGLAGRYPEEIADNCAATGVEAVEIDLLKGRPVTTLPAAEVVAAVQTLRERDCDVVSLRLPAVDDGMSGTMGLAAECGVGRVVLPLSFEAAEHATSAGKVGVAVSFYNVSMGCVAASRILLGLHDRGLAASFVFSAAGFARMGEKPFLSSYRRRLRRFVDQLDLEDACFDGTPQPLARGNAEIKEMMSVLRCASFGGLFVLTSGNRFVGSLADAAARVEELLEAM